MNEKYLNTTALRVWLAQRSMNQVELARTADISATYLSMFMSRRVPVTDHMIMLLHDVTGLDVDELRAGEHSPKPKRKYIKRGGRPPGPPRRVTGNAVVSIGKRKRK